MFKSIWGIEEIYGLLNQCGIGWVSADSNRFVSATMITGGFAYFRFHGPRQLYSSSYTKDELAKWAQLIRPELQKGDVYCFFNNDFHGYALTNAEMLKFLVIESK